MGVLQLTGKYAEFKVTDVNSTVLVDESFCVYSGTGFETGKNTFGFEIGNIVSQATGNPGMTSDVKNAFTMTFDYATKKMKCIIVNKNGTYTKTVDMPDGAGAIASFAVRSGYNNVDRRCYFDNLLITTTPGDYTIVDADYTVKFVDEGGTEIKESVTRSGTPGSSISATTGDKESFWTSTKKYYYKSDDAAGKTIAANGSTILTITYREAASFNYTVKSSLGTTIFESSTTEGESVTVPYPTYELSGTTLYSSSAIDDNSKKYSKTFTVSANNQEETITYSEYKSNVVFYSEGEDVSGITSTTVGNAGVRGSMCAAGYNGTSGNVTVTTIPEVGIYKITICTYGSKGSYTFKFKAGGMDIVTAEYPGTNGPTYSGIFPVSSSTDIIWPATDANHAIDYIYIEKLSSSNTVSASVSAAGYATFSSPYALDFTENTDVTAYVATGVEVGKVTMTSVEKVPANTGLLLKSNSGAAVQTTSIPVIAETVAAPETNYLKPGTGATVAASTEGTYHYIFAKQNDYVGFFNLASATTVDVGKAYLETTTNIKPATPGARVAIVFGDDETTGIQDLKDSRLEVLKAGDCYNLKGQRVSQPTKGLYIVNGKKVIMK